MVPGFVKGVPTTVRALAYITAGHLTILRDCYA